MLSCVWKSQFRLLDSRARLQGQAHSALGCAGTQLCGTGIDVSALTRNSDLALGYTRWLAGAEH